MSRPRNSSLGDRGNRLLLPNFRWPEPEDDFEEKLVSNVRTHGCSIVNVHTHEQRAGWAFSIGYYINYAHPEVIVFGLSQSTAHSILNDICGRIAKGERFSVGARDDRLLKGLDVCFLNVALDHYRGHFGYANWFYASLAEPFPAIQMIWPDRENRFPWDPDRDTSVRQLQPLLGGFG